ncbi:MAG: ATP-binding protein [Thermoanaerobaculia bacterium]
MLKSDESSSLAKARAEFHKLLFESNPLPMWIYDVESLAFLAVNDSAVAHYGYSRDEFLRMSIVDIRPPAETPAPLAFFNESQWGSRSGEQGFAGHWRHRKKDGAHIDVEVHRTPLTYEGMNATLVIARDLTEQRRLDDQLRSVQKMEAVSRLAGGVAHDFNNILTAILGFSELVLSRLPQNDPLRNPVTQIKSAGERAAALTRQLLAFSRKQVMVPQQMNLNGSVSGLERNMKLMLGDHIQLITKLAPDLEILNADPGQVEEIVLRLAANAREAMPSGGTLQVMTAMLDVDAAYARSRFPLIPGRYVSLVVRDSGVGISEEAREHIFEPFFTTKRTGQGTGLGLATVYGIVKQSGGYIWVSSEPGNGTMFEIYFPVVPREMAGMKPGLMKRVAEPDSISILVVEDEDMVRMLLNTLLKEQGHTVRIAASGREALAILADTDVVIDLLLTDVVMPEMNGPELARLADRERPGLKVLYMSGYADKGIVREGVLEPGLAFLPKPFTPQKLAQKIREAVSQEPV